MLFKINGRSLKFCLVGLDTEERKEIAKLITENGGKIRGPSNTQNNRVHGDAFHDFNYIHECLRQGELLDLDPFRTLSLCSPTRKNQGTFLATDDVGRFFLEHNYSKICVKKAPLIVLAPSLDDLSPVYSRYLRQMYTLLTEKNQTEDQTSLEKHKDQTEAPRLWSPIVITRRWVRENAIEAVSQTDDEKFAMQNRTSSSKIVGSEEPPRIQPTTVEEHDETPLIQRLQEILDDVPLAVRLEQTRKSNVEESENSDDFLNISPTARKRRILSSSSEDSADSNATVLLKDSSRTKRSNRDKGSVDVKTEVKMSEHSYDSEETVLWADFSSKRRKSKDRRNPRRIQFDSTDTETFSVGSCAEKEKKFRRSRESQARTMNRDSVTPFLLSSPCSDETEYEADTEQEDARPSRVATSEEPPGASKMIEISEDEDSRGEVTSSDMGKKVTEELQNERDPNPGNSSKCTDENEKEGASSTGSNDVISISDDSDSDSSSEAETADVPEARIAVPVEAPKKRAGDRIERPAMNVERRIQYHRLTRNYTPWEQKVIVNYLIDNNAVSMSKGYEIWKQLINDGHLTHRTYQSLHNHFRRSILPNIHRFGIGGFDLEEFRKLKH